MKKPLTGAIIYVIHITYIIDFPGVLGRKLLSKGDINGNRNRRVKKV